MKKVKKTSKPKDNIILPVGAKPIAPGEYKIDHEPVEIQLISLPRWTSKLVNGSDQAKRRLKQLSGSICGDPLEETSVNAHDCVEKGE